METNKEELSKCCNKPKVANYSDEGTGCYLCQGCLGEFIPKKEECNFCRTSKCGNRNEDCYCPCHSPVLEEEKHICCDGECNHDACCGKVEANCPNYNSPQEPMEWESEFEEKYADIPLHTVIENGRRVEVYGSIKDFIANQIKQAEERERERIYKEQEELSQCKRYIPQDCTREEWAREEGYKQGQNDTRCHYYDLVRKDAVKDYKEELVKEMELYVSRENIWDERNKTQFCKGALLSRNKMKDKMLSIITNQ